MKNQTRHETLLEAGWGYTPATGRYTAPGAAHDGTEVHHDQESAWLQYTFTAGSSAAPSSAEAPAPVRSADPRRKEPE